MCILMNCFNFFFNGFFVEDFLVELFFCFDIEGFSLIFDGWFLVFMFFYWGKCFDGDLVELSVLFECFVLYGLFDDLELFICFLEIG